MNRSSFPVKAAALTSSLLLAATFVVLRAEVLDFCRPPAPKPVAVDSSVLSETSAVGLEFDFVGESVPVTGGLANAFSGTDANDHDWLKRSGGHRQNRAPIQVSAEALQLLTDELRTRASEKPDAAMMSGSKTFIIPWKLNKNSGPLVAGERNALTIMAGSKSAIVNWSPITMFSDGAEPLTSVVNPNPSTIDKVITASPRHSK